MAQQKGKTGNPSGRPKGSLNKDTAQIRSFIIKFIKTNSKTLQRDFDLLHPADRFAMFEKLLKYALPTLQNTHISTDLDKLTDKQVDELFQKLISENESK